MTLNLLIFFLDTILLLSICEQLLSIIRLRGRLFHVIPILITQQYCLKVTTLILSPFQGHSKVNPWCTGADLAKGGAGCKTPPSCSLRVNVQEFASIYVQIRIVIISGPLKSQSLMHRSKTPCSLRVKGKKLKFLRIA